MPEIIKISDVRNRAFDTWYDNPLEQTIASKELEQIVGDYKHLLESDPGQAIKQFPDYIAKIKKLYPALAYSKYVPPYLTGPLISTSGIAYPDMHKNRRRSALKKVWSFFEEPGGITAWSTVRDNVSCIDEPWLASDIVYNQVLYQPETLEYNALLNNNSPKSINNIFNSLQGKFWLAKEIMSYKSPRDVRTYFINMHPEFADRTLDGIAAIIVANLTWGVNREPISSRIEGCLRLYAEEVRDDVRTNIDKAKWVKLS